MELIFTDCENFSVDLSKIPLGGGVVAAKEAPESE